LLACFGRSINPNLLVLAAEKGPVSFEAMMTTKKAKTTNNDESSHETTNNDDVILLLTEEEKAEATTGRPSDGRRRQGSKRERASERPAPLSIHLPCRAQATRHGTTGDGGRFPSAGAAGSSAVASCCTQLAS